MKYTIGDVVLLYSGEDVYIYDVDQKAKEYFVINNSNSEDIRKVGESEISNIILTI